MFHAPSSTRSPLAALAMLCLAVSALTAACGGHAGPSDSPTAGTSLSPAVTRPATPEAAFPLQRVASPSQRVPATELVRGSWLRPPYREYTLRGSWSVWGYTDTIAALTNSKRGHYPALRIHLMRLADGRVRPVLTRPLNAKFRFETGNVAVSGRWLVWEEVGPGDDLEIRVPWRLYAAPLDSARLSIGKPFLVVGGHTAAMSRPLIDLDGDRLAWMVNVGDVVKGQSQRGELRVVDLKRHRSLFAWQAAPAQILRTLSLQGQRIWAVAQGRGIRRGPRLLVFGLADAAPKLGLDLDEDCGINHWPAVHHGYVSWSAFLAPENPRPTLYLRAPGAGVQTIADCSSEPTFVGRYLFYERETPGTQRQPGETSEIWAYDLKRHQQRPLVVAELAHEGQWLLGVNKSLQRHTLVVWGDMWSTTTYEKSSVKIRVYRIPA